jgi:hypothetical protein
VFSNADLDWRSFSLSITTSSGINQAYNIDDITVIDITDEIKEIRLVPLDLITLIGDTINIRVYIKDIHNRELTLNW